MTHGMLTEPSLSPHDRKGREGNREGNGGLGFPSIDLTVGADAPTSQHIHRFAPAPSGRLFGKVRYRNRCATCGAVEHPQAPTMDGASGDLRRLPRGPACRRCGFPTVPAITDPDNPLHPCCAEPELMALGAATRRRNR